MNRLFFLLLFSISSNVVLLAQVQKVKSKLEVYHLDTKERETIYEANDHFEAPNWSKDGQYFIINSVGSLYKINIADSRKEKIQTAFADKCNNDHGITPNGKQIIISHYDQPEVVYKDRDFRSSRIYTLPISGGIPHPITPNTPSFWHGISPDGQTLLYTALRKGDFDIYSIPINGGQETQLTYTIGLDDGPEFSHDGRHIFYNSMASGKMELWRMDTNGKNPLQITDDAHSNWFPHPSPDGRYLVYLAYLEDQGDKHPAMKQVALKLYDLATRKIETLMEFTGGQGTINVNSWSPDGKSFAFVSYESLEDKLFDAQHLYVLTDGDMPATGYINGQLERPKQDQLSVLSLSKKTIATAANLPISNAVRRWPNSASIGKLDDKTYLLIAEQDGKAPPTASDINDISKGKWLRLVDISHPKAIIIQDSLAFDKIPASVAFHPSKNIFALTFIGDNTIQIGTIKEGKIELLKENEIVLTNETIPAIPHFSWHPSGDFAAISLAGNDKLMFLKYSETNTFSTWGNVLKTAPLPGVGYFLNNGRFFAMTSINLTSDLEQQAYKDNTSLLSLYRFDATEFPDSPPTRGDDGQLKPDIPLIKHTKTLQIPFGLGYVETFAISPDDQYLVGLNMRGSWLPNGTKGKTKTSALELFQLYANNGKAHHIGTFPFDSVLPECVLFDKSGTSLVTASFNHHGYQKGRGSIDFWKLISTENQVDLVLWEQYFMERGVHYILRD